MDAVVKSKRKSKDETRWDENGSQLWTYFNEEIKQRISFFLSQRLDGKNLELGGGWYLSYPDSTVIDLSSVCLDYNPAKEKIHFDLDRLCEGKKLPIRDHSLDSATMISVWQYLKNPDAVMSELERVLKPGSEVYIINGQGAGDEKCMKRSGRTENIERELKKMGYDTLMEAIPSFGNCTEFLSVCAAMPGEDLFGKVPSRIYEKEERAALNEEIKNEPLFFTEPFAESQIERATSLLFRLSTYPITAFSQDYLRRLEEFSEEVAKKTGGFPVLFLDGTIEPELHMATQDDDPFPTLYVMGGNAHFDSVDLREKYDLKYANHGNYFDLNDVDKLVKHWQDFKQDKYDYSGGNYKRQVDKYADFLATIPLNQMTRELQDKAKSLLGKKVADFNEKIKDEVAFNYHMATMEYKQRTRIAELIRKKGELLSGSAKVIGEGKLDYRPYLGYMKKRYMG